ncbi:MAG: hypothetical protein LBI53_07000 [Candidatus Peribacteria bacterium]|nr:hypothetical protein [Candidatus Peribacteria bacterium]
MSDSELMKKFRIENLSPESRGNEGMHAFIIQHIPNNPETKEKAERTEVRNFSMMLDTHL